MYPDLLLIVVSALLLITIGVSALYYARIKEVREEYDTAKNTVRDVVSSFNRQFQRQEDKLHAVTHKIEALSLYNEKGVMTVETVGEQLATLADRIEDAKKIERKVSTQIQDMNKKIDDVKRDQNKATQRINEVEKVKYRSLVSEAKIEAAIPIKKEKALAPLTETELMALEIVAGEGEKTAPEIRERIGLTREHTARLMKKLYEAGYLERDTHKMPYTYRLKEEMRKILKKREAKT
ncbi:MAG: MarR family transcriptional regulator [Candidatus Bathyarchaeota archaeon]|nr:MAG: MarR family transcriptional regulator [Candidatus Bathyarchaeota archaeon]